jgi:hypothetical protein
MEKKFYKVLMHIEEITIKEGHEESRDLGNEILPIPLVVFTEREFQNGLTKMFMESLRDQHYKDSAQVLEEEKVLKIYGVETDEALTISIESKGEMIDADLIHFDGSRWLFFEANKEKIEKRK